MISFSLRVLRDSIIIYFITLFATTGLFRVFSPEAPSNLFSLIILFAILKITCLVISGILTKNKKKILHLICIAVILFIFNHFNSAFLTHIEYLFIDFLYSLIYLLIASFITFLLKKIFKTKPSQDQTAYYNPTEEKNIIDNTNSYSDEYNKSFTCKGYNKKFNKEKYTTNHDDFFQHKKISLKQDENDWT